MDDKLAMVNYIASIGKQGEEEHYDSSSMDKTLVTSIGAAITSTENLGLPSPSGCLEAQEAVGGRQGLSLAASQVQGGWWGPELQRHPGQRPCHQDGEIESWVWVTPASEPGTG